MSHDVNIHKKNAGFLRQRKDNGDETYLSIWWSFLSTTGGESLEVMGIT